MFQWVGVTLAICGAVVLVALYNRVRTDQEQSIRYVAPQPELDALPVPFAITDSKGNIVSISNFMLQLAQKNRSSVDGEKITVILPLDQDTVSLGGRKWRILQAPMSDGTYYFQLEEARNVAITQPVSSEFSFNDPATSLFNRSYATKRVEEELYRVHRYKRWMSAAILRVIFQSGEAHSALSPKKEDEVFNAYCRFVCSNSREGDISCLAGPRDILMVMPETTLEGAQDVVSRLSDMAALPQEEAQVLGRAAKIHDGVIYLNASSGVLDFDRFMEKLDETLKS